MTAVPLESAAEPGDVLLALERLHALLDGVPVGAHAGLAASEQRRAASSWARLKARVAAFELDAVAAVEESATARREGATSTGALLAGDFGGDRRASDATVRDARRVVTTPRTHEAMASGRLTPKQGRLIGRALDQLPDPVTASEREACETQLVDDAPRMDLKTFERAADRLVGSFLPDEPDLDAAENTLLERRERRAWERSEFWLVERSDGTATGGFRIPVAQAAALRVALDALTAPQVELPGPGGQPVRLDERPSFAQRQGWAFAHLCELLPTDELPQTQNVGPLLTVTLDAETLRDTLAAATLSTGERLSAGQARRLACQHRLLPAVFDGDSVPLDVGRGKRLFTVHQRRALAQRDRGCVFPGCDRPPGWCVAHHARERWADGGTTDLADGVLLCPHHHRVLHADGWKVRFADDGMPELIPPAALDRRRRPRRHQRFRRDRPGSG